MKILSIDTSTMISNCSLVVDDRVLGDYAIDQQKTHSESLMPMILTMLEDLDMGLEEIDLFAVAKGPGSFTGLRIGMTVAKTLAQMHGKPIVGISTLEAMAYNASSSDLIVPIIDARGRRVYYGQYRLIDNEMVPQSADRMSTMDQILEEIDGTTQPLIFAGEAVLKYKDELKSLNLNYVADHLTNCIGRSIAILARNKYGKYGSDDLFLLKPEYLRKSQAQLDYELKEGIK